LPDTTKKRASKNTRRASRAKSLAEDQIDKMGDAFATNEERSSRKRRLTKGPSEFRKLRMDQPKKKRRAP
jgi:hypothetical protein